MHFKAMPAPKSRTPKQDAQEPQAPTKAFITTITTDATAITTTITTTKKAKGRVLSLERWH
jgi:hypothetical protein